MKALLLLPLLGPPPQAFTPDGFRIARPGHIFRFPQDHGSHPDFRSEWWYYTGMARTEGGATFGFQLTFFRQAAPPSAWKGNAHWRSDQIHLAHAAITDVSGRRFDHTERLQRGGLLADAAQGRLQVFNGAWSAEGDGTRQRLHFQVGNRALDLEIRPLAPPVIFGEGGVSRKGEDPGAASHYVTFPRMAASGFLREGGASRPLRGEAWMDHEWSSNQLSRGQVGWDWAGIRLRDGRSLMAYRLRRADGSMDPWSTLSEVDASGRITRATRAWSMAPLSHWTSPATGITYPSTVRISAWGESWVLEPLLRDQELRTRRSNGITYWEGACDVKDASGQTAGEAYLELTGYGASLRGRF